MRGKLSGRTEAKDQEVYVQEWKESRLSVHLRSKCVQNPDSSFIKLFFNILTYKLFCSDSGKVNTHKNFQAFYST